MKRYAQKRKKVGIHSRYYLYMEFLPQFQNPRKDFTYNDDDLERLKILLKKKDGRYGFAKVVDRGTKTVLGIHTPEGRFSEFEWKNKQRSQTKSLLRASIAFKQKTEIKRALSGEPSLLTIYSRDTNAQGQRGKDIALNNIRQDVLFGPFGDDFRAVFIYDGVTNDRVAEMDDEGNLFTTKAFYVEIKGLRNEKVYSFFEL